jgi:transcriptional regulator of arginine metabolism
MKNERQEAILHLISAYAIDTQELLQEKLAAQGYAVTQATISRDIRELKLAKVTDQNGIYRYCAPAQSSSNEPQAVSDTLLSVLKHAGISVDYANNLVVVKTHAGMGNAVGAAVDALALTDCLGTLAGDDTLLIIAKTVQTAEKICANLRNMIAKDID